MKKEILYSIVPKYSCSIKDEDIEVLQKMGSLIVEIKELKTEESVVCSLTGSPSDYNEDY